MENNQTTFIMIKPDGVERGLVDEIIGRFERIGLRMLGRRDLTPPLELAEAHYAVHSERPFYSELIEFITSGPVVAMAWNGEDAIAASRKLIGATNWEDAEPGTIRADFARSIDHNVIHGSDGEDTAEFELGLWFPDGLED
jgi:nucleoside-diphosphate kinase|tara:strand:- start:1219 stop:1641 length:423 start_codon:yes stop_codon:yes gene_type:complete